MEREEGALEGQVSNCEFPVSLLLIDHFADRRVVAVSVRQAPRGKEKTPNVPRPARKRALEGRENCAARRLMLTD